MPATDTLRSPQAKTTFRASDSFLILMVLSMREFTGLCSGVIICNNKHREITKSINSYTVRFSVSARLKKKKAVIQTKLYKWALPLASHV